MNYEDMSDKQIDELVAKAVGGVSKIGLVKTENGKIVDESLITKSYCNNPSDAWPVIESIWGELMKPPYRGHGTTWERLVGEYSCGKLRAAMICFLKIKDAEK